LGYQRYFWSEKESGKGAKGHIRVCMVASYEEGSKVNNRQLKQTALSLTEGEVKMVETIGKFTVAREAMLIAPTKSAFEANPQAWQTNEDWDLRLDLETC